MECELRPKEHNICVTNTAVYGEWTAAGMKWTSPTCGHKVSMWLAAIWTIFVPSSFVDNEQARLATSNKINKLKLANSHVSKYSCSDFKLAKKISARKPSFWKRVFCQTMFLNKETPQEKKGAVERGDSDEKSYDLTPI